ncbi:MAG: hypothetical protein R2771_08365 [Saprospiraceae bacterium]
MNLYSQNDSIKSKWKDKFEFKGYTKLLNITSFQNFDNLINQDYIHNRLNFKAYVSKNFDVDFQLRNRLFWGDSLTIKYIKSSIDTPSDIKLSGFVIDKGGLLLNSKIDRLSLNFNFDDFEIKIGRQRINWGKTLTWNVNDLFNAFNFLDYDYEERPGTDAIDIVYNMKNNAFLEAAYSYGKSLDESIYALRYQRTIGSYDIQAIAGNYFKDIVFGMGWEGYISNAGFKGEFSYFTPKDGDSDENNAFLISLSSDYYFQNGLSLIGSILFNSNGSDEISSYSSVFSGLETLNARNLMPNKWSCFVQSTYQITPLTIANFGLFYLPDINSFGILPGVSYSMADNWDLNFFAQVFFLENDDKLKNAGNSIILRIRNSF